MHPLTAAVHQFIVSVPQVKRVLVACSGGVDSTVLLHCVAKARLPVPVLALHVNHQLSHNADAWQQHVEEYSTQLGVECLSERVSVASDGSGIEQAARQARYRAFDSHLRTGDLLLTAHHLQDQAETFFLRLLRGAGLRGLGAMAPLRNHGEALVGRPLLQQPKQALLEYARTFELQWVEDESNQQQHYDRNFLRAEVMPLLQQRWPRAAAQIAHTTELLHEAQGLLSLYAQQDVNHCQPQQERVGASLLFSPLLQWTPARRQQVIRTWLAGLGHRMPEHKQFAELDRLLCAQADRAPVLLWQDCEIRRFQQRLYCLPKHWQPGCIGPAKLSMGGQVFAGSCSELRAVSAGQGLAPAAEYSVRVRNQCAHITRAHPAARRHSQTFKKLLQEYQVEPWLRPWLPLVFEGDKLVAVADLWVEHAHLYRGVDAISLRWCTQPDSHTA